MVKNIRFKFLIAGMLELVKAETSRLGASIRKQDGTSAYDDILIHTNDEQTIKDFITDAEHQIETRFGEDAVMSTIVEEDDPNHIPLGVLFRFFLPDADEGTAIQAKQDFGRYITLYATASWLDRKGFKDQAASIATSATDAFSRGVAILRTRVRPGRNDL